MRYRDTNTQRAMVMVAALVVCALVWGACGDSAHEDAFAKPEAGEELPGGDTTNRILLGSNAFIKPAANLDPENEAMFFSGNSFFNLAWVQAPSSTANRDGLGPLFNARSCSACHFKDGRGRPALTPDEAHAGLLIRLSVPGQGEHGAPKPEPTYGGQLQDFGLPDIAPEGKIRITTTEIQGTYGDGTPYTLHAPEYTFDDLAYGPLAADVLLSPRVATAMIGLGLLEAIPEARLEALADPDDADGDGISGRLNRVWDVQRGDFAAGRFGWKAEQPTVLQQSAGAFHGDMGLTSRLFPDKPCAAGQTDCLASQDDDPTEVEDHLLDRVAVYSRTIAPPVRVDWKSEAVLNGKRLFHEAGCAACHVPSHTTGAVDDIPALADQLIWPYTDLLLHDMGPALADNAPSFEADGQEWRTPPLWGLSHQEDVNGHMRLLHDGRADGVVEAILWHGGEAERAQRAFLELSREDRAALVRFVESL